MVKKEDRDESQQKLRVVTKSIELMHYTQQITSNVKVFKPEYNWLTSVLLAETINIHRLVYSANEDNLKDEFESRNKKQKDALKLCNNLKADILVAKKTYHLRAKRVTYWTNKVKELKSLIQKWMESDRKRYKELNKS